MIFFVPSWTMCTLHTTKGRVTTAFQTVARCIESHAGVQTHLGKLEAWSPSGRPPPAGLQAVSPKAWKGDAPAEENGITVLGVPVGSPAYVTARMEKRLAEETRLLQEIPLLPYLRCSWALLLQCLAALGSCCAIFTWLFSSQRHGFRGWWIT